MVRDVAKTVLVDIRDHDKNDCERNVFCVEKARTFPSNLTIFHLCSMWKYMSGVNSRGGRFPNSAFRSNFWSVL